MRPYELMLIFHSDLDDAEFQAQIARFREQAESRGGRIAKTDAWGRRRFAYEIDHKVEGYYVVFELLLEATAVEAFDRQFRLADEVVRHKFIRLPDHEAAKRGLLGTDQAEAAPAS